MLALCACSDDGGATDSVSPADSAVAVDSAAADTAVVVDSAAADTAVVVDSSAEDNGGADAALDPYSGYVECAGASCSLPSEVCCVKSPLLGGSATFGCKVPASCQAGMAGASIQAPQFCDGPEDCTAAGPVCCAIVDMLQMSKSGAYCVADADCKGDKWQAIVCHSDKDCSGTRTCVPCKPPGPGYTVKMCVENGTCPF